MCTHSNINIFTQPARAQLHVTIFSTGGKFHPDYGLLLELHALTLVVSSYVLLLRIIHLE